MEVLGAVNYRIQKSERSRSFVTHVDKLRLSYGENPPNWLKKEDLTVSTDESVEPSTVVPHPKGRPRRSNESDQDGYSDRNFGEGKDGRIKNDREHLRRNAPKPKRYIQCIRLGRVGGAW
jgi:hypothetical protein